MTAVAHPSGPLGFPGLVAAEEAPPAEAPAQEASAEDGRTRRAEAAALLAEPALLADLTRRVRGRVAARDVEDLVQATLAEALASPILPETAEEVRRFAFVIARHKIVDWHRRRRRESLGEAPLLTGLTGLPHPTDPAELADTALGPDAGVSEDLLRWAERELPKVQAAAQTLTWMLRESDGEKLADIAAGERIEPAVVRKRVSRLRRLLRERWVLQAGAFGLLLVGGFLLSRFVRFGSAPIATDQNVEPEPAARPGGGPHGPGSASASAAAPRASLSVASPSAPPTVDMVLRATDVSACFPDASLDGTTGSAIVAYDSAGRVTGASATFDADPGGPGTARPGQVEGRCVGGLLGVARLPPSPGANVRAPFRIEGRKLVWSGAFVVQPPPQPPPPVVVPSSSAPCAAQPFVIGSDGVKHPRPECMGKPPARPRTDPWGPPPQTSGPRVDPWGPPPQSSAGPRVDPWGPPPQTSGRPRVDPWGPPPQTSGRPRVDPWGPPPQSSGGGANPRE